MAITELHQENKYPISALCQIAFISRSAYYKWLKRNVPEDELENIKISKIIESIHKTDSDKGYRRIRDDLYRYHDVKVNDKRVLRICLFFQPCFFRIRRSIQFQDFFQFGQIDIS